MQSPLIFFELHPYLTALITVVVLLLISSVRIANQYERAVVFFLGRYVRTLGPGLYLLFPFLAWRTTVDMRTTTTAVVQPETITSDNVPIKINAVIWRRIVNPARSIIEVERVGGR